MNFRLLPRGLRAASGALALLFVASASAQTVDNKPEVKAQVIEKITGIIEKYAYVPGVDFAKWPQLLAEAKPKIDAAKDDTEFQRAVNEALAKFGTSHIVLATPKQSEVRRTGSTVGVGISTQLTDNGELLIVRTVPDAPAERAGLVPGDTITEADGKKVEGSIAGIIGKEGTDVVLTVRHADDKVEKYVLTRRPFSTVRPEELTWIDKDTAKISIYTFDFSYDRENVEDLMNKAHKAKNLILDLRDNGGGAVINLQHMLGMLIPDAKPFGTFVGRSLVDRYVKEAKGKPDDLAGMAKWSDRKVKPFPNANVPVYKGNLAVLVNGFSGSAAEIAAAALRDEANATIVGTKSAGAVLVSMIVNASNGFMIQYPLSDYITAKGLRLEGTGVVPDVEAKDPRFHLPNAKDEVVDKAVALFAQSGKGAKSSGH
ncbi:S41 family peptidase [Fimbriimonas ginsengisoli]|uniref:Carboxyl-terminal protease n=1 Tax=Fimbriimonas ginsengisoli Gsoil 348 TaxID=661478 RepID=A0A068NPV1_FIMGI|nr:S41 family peptidase [Fimbriimonas ginsengisoli]AIE83609.1 carboxyl-terminal protease [Fimbriimonas ginsengisoli Gsoil 348]